MQMLITSLNFELGEMIVNRLYTRILFKRIKSFIIAKIVSLYCDNCIFVKFVNYHNSPFES